MYCFKFKNYSGEVSYYHYLTESSCRKHMKMKVDESTDYCDPKPQYRGKGKKLKDLLMGFDEDGYEWCTAEYIGKTELD